MEPVEINAGAWYLRAPRDDDRLSDVPALADLFALHGRAPADPAGFVDEVHGGWRDESRFVWAVAVPTTGELAAVIGFRAAEGVARLAGVARAGFDESLTETAGSVARFAEGALGLSPTDLVTGEYP